MAEIITMPRLSDTMEEGVIASWSVKVGDTVSSGDLLAEIESDKATMDFEAPEDGTILHIGVAEGDAIPVGSLLVIIGEKGEDVSELVKSHAEQASAAPAEEPAKEETPVEAAAPVVVEAKAPASPSPIKETTPVAPVSPVPSADGRVLASPLAKAMAKDKGIDISRVNGTGDHGRIVKRDIENYQPSQDASQTAVNLPVVSGTESFEEVRVSQMRKTIAKRLSGSKFSAPHFYLTMKINMDNVVEARKALNEVAPVKISYNDIVIKAAAAALRQHPKVNASWQESTIRYNNHIHIGMAVAVDEGLLVPVIRFADSKGLATISQEARALATKARNKELQPAEWAGNTFTISNLGMFGIDEFTAIINSPDACIMAVGGISQVPVVKNGAVVPGNIMKVTLSCDHRVVDGALGAAFLKTFKEYMEAPLRILL